MSLDDVQTTCQCEIVLASLLPPLVCQCDGIAQRGIRQRQSRCIGYSTRYVGYAIVQDTLLGIDRGTVPGSISFSIWRVIR